MKVHETLFLKPVFPTSHLQYCIITMVFKKNISYLFLRKIETENEQQDVGRNKTIIYSPN